MQHTVPLIRLEQFLCVVLESVLSLYEDVRSI